MTEPTVTAAPTAALTSTTTIAVKSLVSTIAADATHSLGVYLSELEHEAALAAAKLKAYVIGGLAGAALALIVKHFL